jgi:hypothetical protein
MMKKERKHFFDDPRNVQRVLKGFWVSLFTLLAIDFFVVKHPYFAWEEWPQFYAVYGFVACVALVLASKYLLRPIVKRKEDYYD